MVEVSHLLTFGEQVRQARKALGLTQGQLAKDCGTATAIISKLETGHIAKPKSKNRRCLEERLDIQAPDTPPVVLLRQKIQILENELATLREGITIYTPTVKEIADKGDLRSENI